MADNLTFVIKADTAEAQKAISALTGTLGKLVASGTTQLLDPTARLRSGLDKSNRSLSSFHVGLQRLGRAALAYAGFSTLTKQVGALGDAIEKKEAALSKLNFANSGDVRKTAEDWRFAVEQANRLGQPLEQVTDSLGNLEAATKGTALEGAATKQIFLGVAEAATVLKLSADSTNGAFVALTQMVGKGKVSAEEFRQQLGERMPIALEAGARALGVTREKFNELLEAGKLDSISFLPKFAEELRKMAQEQLPAATQSFIASKNRLRNAILELRQDMGEGELGTTLKDSIDGLTASLNDPGLRAGMQLLAIGFAKPVQWVTKLFELVANGTRIIGSLGGMAASNFVAGFQIIVPNTLRIFNKVVGAMKRALASAMESLAKGAQSAGANDLAETLYDSATAIRVSANENAKAAAAAKKEIDAIIAFNDARKQAIREGAGDPSVPKPKAGATTTPAITSLPVVPIGPGGKEKGDADARREGQALAGYLRAVQQYAEVAARAERDKAQAELERDLDARLITQREFLRKKAGLELQEIEQARSAKNQRIAELRAVLEAEKSTQEERLKAAAELVQINAALEELDGKKAVIGVRLTQDTAKVKRDLDALKADIEANILDMQGKTAEGARKRLERETAELLKSADGDGELEALIETQRQAKLRIIDIQEATEQAQGALSNLSTFEAGVQQQIQSGMVGELAGQEKIRQARLATADAMRASVFEAERLAALTKDPAQIQHAAQLRQQYEDLASTMDGVAVQLNESFFGAIKQGWSDLITGAKSFGEVMRNIASSVLAKMAEMSLNNFLSKAMAGMGGSSGGLGGLLSGAMKLFGFDAGGYTGPGARLTPKGIVHANEYVTPSWMTDWLRRTGMLNWLEGIRVTRRIPSRMPGFDSGGLTSGAPIRLAGGSSSPTTVENAIAISPRVEVTTGQLIDGLRRDSNASRWVLSVINENRRALGLSG